jgi:hypothetical protein
MVLRIPLRGTRLRRAVDPGDLCQPTRPDGEGQARGQARPARGGPPQSDTHHEDDTKPPHSIIPSMASTPKMPSLKILLDQVASERATVSARADGLDTKAGVVLGFAGVLVGLGATASTTISTNGVFQAGLGVAVVAALSAAFAFVPRKSPVLQMRPARDKYLTADESVTQLILLDTQLETIKITAELVKQKGNRLEVSVICLAIAAVLVVVGTLTSGGQANGQRAVPPQPSISRTHPGF